MDIALAIEALVPGADYGGSVTANDEAAYNALRWDDARTKPSWADLIEVDTSDPVPEPGTVAPRQVAAAFGMAIANEDVSAIAGPFNIAGGAYLGVGTYMLFFLNEQPDANYFAVGSNAAVCAIEKETWYVVIEARGVVGGSLIDPSQIDVQIFRIEP